MFQLGKQPKETGLFGEPNNDTRNYFNTIGPGKRVSKKIFCTFQGKGNKSSQRPDFLREEGETRMGPAIN